MTAIAEWKTGFGNDYTQRNVLDPALRTQDFRRILRGITPDRILEVGCNRGHNLVTLKAIFPDALIAGTEPNDQARAIAQQVNPWVVNSALPKLPFLDSHYDLVLTAGVLIHIPPEEIEPSIAELVRVSKKHVLVMEYFAPESEEIEYRGHSGMLWKRDYGRMLERAGLRFTGRGFLPKSEAWDDVTWWLFSK